MDQLRRFLGSKDDPSDRQSSLICNAGSFPHGLDRSVDQGSRVLGCFCRFAGQIADFISNHGKTFPRRTGSGCFNSCIQGENIGLKSDVFYGFNDFTDFRGRIIDLVYCSRHLLHLLFALFQIRCCRHSLFAGYLCVLCIICHVTMDFIDCGCQFFYSGGLLCSALGQGVSTAGNLVRTGGYFHSAGIQLSQCIVQRINGILERIFDWCKISHIIHIHL